MFSIAEKDRIHSMPYWSGFGVFELFTPQHDSLRPRSCLHPYHGGSMGSAWEATTALRAFRNISWILTLSHGLEVQFATVASKAGHGARPDLEHVDASWLQAADHHGVGLAPDGGSINLWLVLGEEKATW